MQTFHSKVEKFAESELWTHHFKIERGIATSLIKGKNRRVLCSINGQEAFQCAIMRGANELFFINLNKDIRNKFGLLDGEVIKITLRKDEGEYGLPFPEAFTEVLYSDTKARGHFEKLSPGKQRNLLYMVNKMKSLDKKIEKSIVIAEHLKKMKGKIDFKQLNEDFKNYPS